jgi:protocatechuate 3,4-dioxygenase beta subunit
MSASRRRFLVRSLVWSGLGVGLIRTSWGLPWLEDGLTPTAVQTKGPFYPIPEIEKQKYYDADLTRLDDKAPVAEGDQIVVRGSVVNFEDRPLSQVVVEVWQACTTGRYNHPQDRNDRPMDPNFQYWARILTGEDGSFSFRTIQPGKYPGRTPHIHYRIVAKDHPELVTQMYFESNEEFNRRDGIYMDLSPEQRKSVTVAMESKALDVSNPQSEKLPTGNFKIVLGPLGDAKATRPM